MHLDEERRGELHSPDINGELHSPIIRTGELHAPNKLNEYDSVDGNWDECNSHNGIRRNVFV